MDDQGKHAKYNGHGPNWKLKLSPIDPEILFKLNSNLKEFLKYYVIFLLHFYTKKNNP